MIFGHFIDFGHFPIEIPIEAEKFYGQQKEGSYIKNKTCFGGIPNYLEVYKNQKETVRCWNLLGELEKTEENQGNELKVQGIMGALGLYHKAIRKTTLAGPTYFAGMLKRFLNVI